MHPRVSNFKRGYITKLPQLGRGPSARDSRLGGYSFFIMRGALCNNCRPSSLHTAHFAAAHAVSGKMLSWERTAPLVEIKACRKLDYRQRQLRRSLSAGLEIKGKSPLGTFATETRMYITHIINFIEYCVGSSVDIFSQANSISLIKQYQPVAHLYHFWRNLPIHSKRKFSQHKKLALKTVLFLLWRTKLCFLEWLVFLHQMI